MMAVSENLNYILNPKTIAIVGASRDSNSVGYGILKSLVMGGVFHSEYCRAFSGKIFPINPHADEILGQKCYKNLKDVNDEIDLAVICVPAQIVPLIMKDCVKKKIKGAIIISAGFGETGEEGRKLQQKVLSIAREGKIRIIGPNCLGIIRTSTSMNASFAPSMPPKGNVAFISQSGALADSIIDWAIGERFGLSLLISYGNRADLDVPDFLEWLATDNDTKAISN